MNEPINEAGYANVPIEPIRELEGDDDTTASDTQKVQELRDEIAFLKDLLLDLYHAGGSLK